MVLILKICHYQLLKIKSTMKNKYIQMSLVRLLLSLTAFSQTNNRHSFYSQIPFLHNPAYAGLKNETKFFLKSNQSMVGMPDAPKNYLLGAHGQISSESGAGAVFTRQTHSIFTEYFGSMSYSHTLTITNDISIAVGLSAGFVGKSIDNSLVTEKKLDDPVLNNDNYSHSLFTAAMGTHLVWKNLFWDVSSPSLYRDGDEDVGFDIYSLLGYSYKTYKDRVNIQPMVGFYRFANFEGVVEAAVNLSLDDTYWVNLKSNQNVIHTRLANYTGIEHHGLAVTGARADQAVAVSAPTLAAVLLSKHSSAAWHSLFSFRKSMFCQWLRLEVWCSLKLVLLPTRVTFALLFYLVETQQGIIMLTLYKKSPANQKSAFVVMD